MMNLDNRCAILYIQKQGGIKVLLDLLANEFWSWCKRRNIWITARHIPGSKNIIADSMSRKFNDNIEWSLQKESYDLIVDLWGKPSVDLFGSRLNHKVNSYVSF